MPASFWVNFIALALSVVWLYFAVHRFGSGFILIPLAMIWAIAQILVLFHFKRM
jgi:hypothetical protein